MKVPHLFSAAMGVLMIGCATWSTVIKYTQAAKFRSE